MKYFWLGIILLFINGILFAAMVKPRGFFLEANIGYGKVNQTIDSAPKNSTEGLAGNANVGYQISRQFAIETGYTQFPNQNLGAAGRGKQNYAVDLAVQGIIPFDSGFNFFGKGGIALVNHHLQPASGWTLEDSGNYQKLAAYLGFGINYAVTPQLLIGTQANMTTKSEEVPAMFLIGLGLTYLF